MAILFVLAGVAAGFGLGRIKNARKLAAVSAVIAKAENSVVAEEKALAAAVKSKL